MSVFKIVASYALLFGIVGVFVWHSSGRPNLLAKLRPATNTATTEPSSGATKSRRRAKRTGGEKEIEESSADASPSVSGAKPQDKAGSKKRKINTGTAESDVGAAVASEPNGVENGFSDRDIAKQMTQTREGKQSAPSVESQRDTMAVPAGLSTGASSTTGGDADDDMSPANSPALGPATAGGVEDMLPTSAASRGVLRITGEAPAPKAARNSAKAPESTETKKQRQARRKREEQKARNEEAERERLRLQQDQIRRARTAAGTSNEQKANAFKASQQNVWATRAQNGAVSTPQKPAVIDGPLLDTFDDSAATAHGADGISSSAGTKESVSSLSSVEEPTGLLNSATNRPKNAVGNHHPGAGPAGGWMDNVPSEEEQLRRIKEQDEDDSWNTVASKKKKNAKGDGSDASGPEPTIRSGDTVRPAASQSQRPQVNASNSFARVSEVEV